LVQFTIFRRQSQGILPYMLYNNIRNGAIRLIDPYI
jgi:hypothetical protein